MTQRALEGALTLERLDEDVLAASMMISMRSGRVFLIATIDRSRARGRGREDDEEETQNDADASRETRDARRETPLGRRRETKTTDDGRRDANGTQATVNAWCVIRTCVRRRSCACATSVITERIRDGASYAAASA